MQSDEWLGKCASGPLLVGGADGLLLYKDSDRSQTGVPVGTARRVSSGSYAGVHLGVHNPLNPPTSS